MLIPGSTNEDIGVPGTEAGTTMREPLDSIGVTKGQLREQRPAGNVSPQAGWTLTSSSGGR